MFFFRHRPCYFISSPVICNFSSDKSRGERRYRIISGPRRSCVSSRFPDSLLFSNSDRLRTGFRFFFSARRPVGFRFQGFVSLANPAVLASRQLSIVSVYHHDTRKRRRRKPVAAVWSGRVRPYSTRP